MPDYFAVADVGSNALRFQVARADQPGLYLIVMQDRKAVRLGHEVFQTGRLHQGSADLALDALWQFKKRVESYQVKRLHAVATSALREAIDAQYFLAQAADLGVSLEVLSEQDEARLACLGITSELRFDPSLSLFVDIGGGSVEFSVCDARDTAHLSSLPLGAVRLTERFLHKDPPQREELNRLRGFIRKKIGPTLQSNSQKAFTMAFGCGGTVNALACADYRLNGESPIDSLYVLKRSNLARLLDRLRRRSVNQRSKLIPSDPKRADIILAGSEVLSAIMAGLDLKHLLVSQRGLRDGVMIQLLSDYYSYFKLPWKLQGDHSAAV